MRPPICLVLTSCEVPDTQKYPPSDFWVEVRFDCIAGFNCHSPEKHDAWLASLLKLYKNVLITFRPQSRVEQQNEVRYLCYCHWVKMGVPYIDVDFYEPFTEELLALCKHQEGRTQIILSHHIYQYDGNLAKIRHIIREMKKYNPVFCKMAVHCSEAMQALELLSLYKEFPHDLIFSMGREGGFSRIAIPFLGAPYTYAAYSDSIAPGLLPADLLLAIFDWWDKHNA